MPAASLDRFKLAWLVVVACSWFCASASIARATPEEATRRFSASHLGVPSLLVAPQLFVAPQLSVLDPSPAEPTVGVARSEPARLDGFGLALIGALGAGVATSVLTIDTLGAGRRLFEHRASTTTIVTSAVISALGATGWAVLRARHGPLSPQRRLATWLVFGTSYLVITGIGLVGLGVAASH